MEFTKCQMSYDFVQPKLLEWPAQSNACNYSRDLPSDVAQAWIRSGYDLDLTESNSIIRSALKHQTGSRAQSKPQPRRLRRQALGLDQVQAAPRPSLSSMDSFMVANQTQDTPLGKLLTVTEKQLSLRGSFRAQPGMIRAPSPSFAESADPATPVPAESQPTDLSASHSAITKDRVDSNVMASSTTMTISSIFPPPESLSSPPPESELEQGSKTLATLRITESLLCVEKQGAAKMEISGNVQLQEGPSAGCQTIGLGDVASSVWIAKEMCEGATLHSGDLQLEFSRLHPGKLFSYTCQSTFQPQVLKAKNIVSSQPDAKGLQIVVQLALNPQFSHPLENLTVQVSLAAMLQKIAAKGEVVDKISPAGGDSGYNAARKIITWTLTRHVHPSTERKLALSAEVALEEMNTQAPMSIPMVVKAQYSATLLSGACPGGAGEQIAVVSSTQMEWKYL